MDDLRLWDMAGGFIGRASEVGVPGIETDGTDGAGEPGILGIPSGIVAGREIKSGGAGLLAEIRRGISILVTLL